MSKILYGVSGEGSGHSSRARVIANHLIASGHEVKLVSYDRGYRNLKDDFDVLEVVGLSIISEDNQVSKRKTFSANLAKIPQGASSLKKSRHLFKDFRPDCVISDYEPFTAHLASHYGLPLITLDNQHRLRYTKIDCPNKLKKDFFLAEMVTRAIAPRPWVSLVTSFHSGEVKNDRTIVFPPILRESILNLTPTQGRHILIYATSGFDSLLNVLSEFEDESFVVYGYNKTETQANIQFKPFSSDGFANDLSSTKAVIATAGFTLLTESLHLGKPYLALPMQGQFEQHLNAIMLERQGVGCYCDVPNVETIATFLATLPQYSKRLQSYPHNGNELIKRKLDQLLDDKMTALMAYRR
jgi:uncharacterized protein (TIGR00661 family)